MVTGQSAERGRRNWRRRGCILAVSILVNLSAIADGGAQDTRAMISSFFRLPPRIGLVDVTPEAFGSRADEVRKVRAFTFPAVYRTTIYVNTDDPLWKHARSGEHREFYRAILASVVAHELWHLNHGASESGALREELRVWRSFILDKLVPTAEGLQHAVLLEQDIRAAWISELQAADPQRLTGGELESAPEGTRSRVKKRIRSQTAHTNNWRGRTSATTNEGVARSSDPHHH